MGVRTRVGIMSLVESRLGSVELPEEVTLYCPQCLREAADKGGTKVQFEVFPSKKEKDSHPFMEVKLTVDCECGCMGEAPLIKAM